MLYIGASCWFFFMNCTMMHRSTNIQHIAEEYLALVYKVLRIPTEILTNTLTKFCRYSGTRIFKIPDSQIRVLKFIINKTLDSNKAIHKLYIVKL
jgi:hypothetical protein